jgi:hypothetical protein
LYFVQLKVVGVFVRFSCAASFISVPLPVYRRWTRDDSQYFVRRFWSISFWTVSVLGVAWDRLLERVSLLYLKPFFTNPVPYLS